MDLPIPQDMYVTDRWRKSRRARLWFMRKESGLEDGTGSSAVTATTAAAATTAQRMFAEPVAITAFDRQYEDRYASPGATHNTSTALGIPLVHCAEDGSVVLFGAGASPRGERPFVDLMQVGAGSSFERVRLWRCAPAPLQPNDQPEDTAHEVDNVTVPDSDREPVHVTPSAAHCGLWGGMLLWRAVACCDVL
jgi:hypothetical protein